MNSNSSKITLELSLLIFLVLIPANVLGNPLSRKKELFWKKIRDAYGIKVYKKDFPDSPLMALKGVGIIESSIPKITSVLIDWKRSHEWVDRLVENKIISYISPTERTMYNHTDVPWPAWDRDFIMKQWADADRKEGWLRFSAKSIEIKDYSTPKNRKVIRGFIEGTFTLFKTEVPGKTKVVVELFTDPKGSIPKWLVNLIQKRWPVRTLRALKGQLNRVGEQTHSKIEDFFQGKTNKLVVFQDESRPNRPTTSIAPKITNEAPESPTMSTLSSSNPNSL